MWRASLPSGRNRFVRRNPFEISVLAAALIYAALQLSPSSYALALDALGQHVTAAIGTPRAIRSDEWAVETPLFEAAVRNNFHEANATSFYRESLRTVVGLPIANWGLAFKPQLWPFFFLPPSMAYSIWWAALAALMLVGWSLLLRVLGFRRSTAALVSVLLFLTPFVQAWWTSLASQLALFPWVVLAAVWPKKPQIAAAAFAVALPLWLLAELYTPGIPPLLFLALVVSVALRPEIFAPRRLLMLLLGASAGGVIAYVYYRPVFSAFAHSVYPGSRWSSGGSLPRWQAWSQFLPGTTTEGYENLVAGNICEVSTVATWLPVLAICCVDYQVVVRRFAFDPKVRTAVRSIGVLLLGWALLTLWQLTRFFFPLSYLLGLGLSTEGRALFGSGTLLLLAAALAVDRVPLRFTTVRLGAFGVVVAFAWLLASYQLQRWRGLVWHDELVVLFPLVAASMLTLTRAIRKRTDLARSLLILVAIAPAAVGWGLFNPLQSTRVMFRKPQTAITQALDVLASKRSDHAIATPGFFPGAILNGVGYRSVTHTLVTPSPGLFRRFFPGMKADRFRHIFDRYANIGLADAKTPMLPQPDVVLLPLRTMARYAATPCRGRRVPARLKALKTGCEKIAR